MGARIVVLVSGTGTNLAALLDATRDPAYGATVVAVGSDRPGIPALDIAAEHGVPTFVRPLKDSPDRDAWNDTLADDIASYDADVVVCAGFMKLLRGDLVRRWPTLNTHPALSPSFPGAHPVEDTLAHGVKISGATLFLVDDGVDTGPIVAQVVVPVRDDDSVETLHARIKSAEHTMLVETVGRMMRDGYRVEGRHVTLA